MKPGPKRQLRVEPGTGCHVPVCESVISKHGYTLYMHAGRRTSGARVVWMEQRGPIPDGLQVDHLCRNRACVNVEHLEIVTCAENIRRSPRVKLTKRDVLYIRSSGDSGASLARQFGVCEATICHVRKGETWRDPDLLKTARFA